MMLRQLEDIVYVSADPWRRVSITGVLEDAGYQVRAYGSAWEFMHAAARRQADNQVADLLLIDGKLDDSFRASELLASLRASQIRIRSVVVASFDSGEDIIDCLRQGTSDFIHFPALPAEMLQVVHRVIALPTIV